MKNADERVTIKHEWHGIVFGMLMDNIPFIGRPRMASLLLESDWVDISHHCNKALPGNHAEKFAKKPQVYLAKPYLCSRTQLKR